MRFGTWNVRSQNRSGSITTAARKLNRYNLYLVGVKEVRWDKRGHAKSMGLHFFLWKRKRKSSIGKRIFVHHRIISAVKRVQFVSDKTSYIVLRGRWCNTIVFNVYEPREEKSDDSKERFYEELGQNFFYHFAKYHIKILLGNFNAKVVRENIFIPTTGYEGLHQDSNDSSVRIIKFPTS